jgi:hypothetical protein
MAQFLYGKAIANMLGGESAGDAFATDYLSDTIRMMLTTSTYSPNLDTHETKTDVTNEVSGAGYTARGAALTTKTITYTAANSWGTTWAASTAYAVGDVVRPTAGNNHLYRCIVAGTSAGSQPTFPTVNGQTVADNTVTWAEIGRGICIIDADNVQWPSSTITARYGVIYRDTGTDSTSPLLALIDFESDKSSSSGLFEVQFSVGLIANLGIWNHATP